MITIFLGAFLVMLNTSTINLALPDLMNNFHTNIDTVKWILTGFMLAMGVAAPITAYIGERFSYKKVYLVSIAGFTLASILCVFSWNISSLPVVGKLYERIDTRALISTSILLVALAIAVFASVLTSRTVTHSKELVVSGNNLSKTLIANKAFTMGANDVFFMTFIIILIALPFSLFLKKEETKIKYKRKTDKFNVALDSENISA